MPIARNTEEMFWSRINKTETCWLWAGSTWDKDGYGLFRFQGKNWRATRLSWTLCCGPIPKGLVVCHQCDTPACVRPSHLFLETQAENIEDRNRKGRARVPFIRPVRTAVSRRTTEASFWSHVTKIPEGCWIWTGRSRDNHGYGQFVHQGQHWKAHRLSWTFTNGPIEKGLCVCHRCDTPECVRPDHLFLGTHRENMSDMRDKGRWTNHYKGQWGAYAPRGERHWSTKLTEADIVTIRQRYAAGESLTTLSQAYKMTRTNASHIVRRKTWTHVT
jgi:hypothetical protein